jgi:hypothetical protein
MSKSSVHWRLNVAKFLHIKKEEKSQQKWERKTENTKTAMSSMCKKCFMHYNSFLGRIQNENKVK